MDHFTAWRAVERFFVEFFFSITRAGVVYVFGFLLVPIILHIYCLGISLYWLKLNLGV